MRSISFTSFPVTPLDLFHFLSVCILFTSPSLSPSSSSSPFSLIYRTFFVFFFSFSSSFPPTTYSSSLFVTPFSFSLSLALLIWMIDPISIDRNKNLILMPTSNARLATIDELQLFDRSDIICVQHNYAIVKTYNFLIFNACGQLNHFVSMFVNFNMFFSRLHESICDANVTFSRIRNSRKYGDKAEVKVNAMKLMCQLLDR